ncbi:hypothetical protein Micbo1qcDRAFT_214129 [Microdochium bolleyi]|uniref:NodB homology domain-containing protein n=1 Tax=Microdochium bolleyi TaxID=196109 RepID=A0A136IVH5_9PEZI|nr:hypothetical protein Micbo1qcDRAFT_214129 [Microdochium bolleyi]
MKTTILSLSAVAGLCGVFAQPISDSPAQPPDQTLELDTRNVGTFFNFRKDNSTISSVPYGELIENCADEGQIAVTLDDGPSQYTKRVLEEFSKYEKDGFKATFFVTGGNMCPITDTECTDIMRSAVKAGHQIASHTWRHEDLDAASTEGRAETMDKNKEALAKALDMDGRAPTYMRPPYGACSEGSGCLRDLGDMGYHVVNWNIDTADWQHCDEEDRCQTSVELFDAQFDGESKTGYNVLTHDIKEYTASVLIPHILRRAKEANYKVVTVGECLNDPKENWYKRW